MSHAMTDEKSPDVWYLIFEQTPPLLRWLLGFLTVGIFTLAGYLYKLHKDHVDDIQGQLNSRLEHTETHINNRMDGIEQRLDLSMNEVNRHLIEIAQNTRKPDADK